MEVLGIEEIPIESIRIPEWAIREFTSEHDIEELAKSIEAHGQFEHVRVRKLEDGSYQLVFGYMRLNACRKIGLKTVKAEIVECTEEEAMAMNVEENMKRYDEHPFDTARKIAYMHRELKLSVKKIAEKLNRDDTWVKMMISIDSITPEAKKILGPKVKDYDKLYQVSTVKDPNLQVKMAEVIVKRNLSREEVRSLARKMNERDLEAIEDVSMLTTQAEYKDSSSPTTKDSSERSKEDELKECDICGKRVHWKDTHIFRYCKGGHEAIDELKSWLHSFGVKDRDAALILLLEVIKELKGLDIETFREMVKKVKGL
ncbi:MAG: ParB/RepB/Spo0J family partition protein [Nitrososphaerota archaeon]